MKISLVKSHGQRSWQVEFNGPYEVLSTATMHIELRTTTEPLGANNESLFHNVKTGQSYTLSGLHRRGNNIVWFVDGLTKNNGADRVVFVVGSCKKPLSHFLPIDKRAIEGDTRIKRDVTIATAHPRRKKAHQPTQ